MPSLVGQLHSQSQRSSDILLVCLQSRQVVPSAPLDPPKSWSRMHFGFSNCVDRPDRQELVLRTSAFSFVVEKLRRPTYTNYISFEVWGCADSHSVQDTPEIAFEHQYHNNFPLTSLLLKPPKHATQGTLMRHSVLFMGILLTSTLDRQPCSCSHPRQPETIKESTGWTCPRASRTCTRIRIEGRRSQRRNANGCTKSLARECSAAEASCAA